jgi:hypothetical protein
MSCNLRRRVLTLIGKPRDTFEIAMLASTITRPVTAQRILSVLIDLERDDRAQQIGNTWLRVAADPAKQYQPATCANSAFTWRP